MDRIQVIMILALFLTMKAVTGQGPPQRCFCYDVTATDDPPCGTRGCSSGYNSVCNSGTPFGAGFAFASDTNVTSRRGCNCPSSSFRGANGYVLPGAFARIYYNYTTCTAFGANAHDDGGYVYPGANSGTDCCNFCCDRNDPYPGSSTPTPSTPSPTTPSPTTPSTSTTSTTTASPTTASTTTASTTTETPTTEPSTTTSTAIVTTTTETPTTEPSTTTSATIVTTTTETPTGESSTTTSAAIVTTTTEPPTSESYTTEPSTTPSTPAPVSSGRKFVLDKWLYLSGLILLVLTTLKIN